MYLVARPGDWIVAPFQCEACWFINVYNRRPTTRLADVVALDTIRRANLDMFWSRASSTLKSIMSQVKDTISRCNAAGRRVVLEEMEPWPIGDSSGMGTALLMLEKSVEPGKNSDSYMQFSTVRKLRSARASVYAATSQAASLRYCLKGSLNHVLHLNDGPTQTVFLERFVKGMEARMPQDSRRNLPLDGDMVRHLLSVLEREWLDVCTLPDRRRWVLMLGAYLAVGYGLSLRGNEVFWVDAGRLCEHILDGKYDSRAGHVSVALVGRFKSEDGDRMHVMPIANTSKSGIKFRMWLERLVSWLKEEGNTSNCPAFCDEEGYMLTSASLEAVMHPILEEMQGMRRFEESIPVGLDVRQWFRMERSLRRGAENDAIDNGTGNTTIELIHRWSAWERSRGAQPGFNMLEHYAYNKRIRYNQISFSYNNGYCRVYLKVLVVRGW